MSLLGGHSVEDEEIKYGLSVTGIVHPDKVLLNEGAKPGDILFLTKPLGTGIMNTAIKGNLLDGDAIMALMKVMATLNEKAARAMLSASVHACTDVTGFGLAGHLKEMIKESLGVEVYAEQLPYFQEAVGFAASGFVPGGLYRNRDFYGEHVVTSRSDFYFDIIFDPQTSGGLLIAIDPAERARFETEATHLAVDYHVIGTFLAEPKGKILLK